MIANPSVPAFRYDPYSKKLTRERYDHREMHAVRGGAIETARKSIPNSPPDPIHGVQSSIAGDSPLWGVILGTLGRQGSFKQLKVCDLLCCKIHCPTVRKQAITHQLEASNTPIPYIPILLSELSPAKLSLFNPHISTFIQTSCPRLSIDWGYAFDRPLLSPYETAVAVGKHAEWMDRQEDAKDARKTILPTYPMDFYEGGSPWAISRSTGAF